MQADTFGRTTCSSVCRSWVRTGWSQDPVHHAWQSLGERVYRELQWQAQRRTPQSRDFYTLKELQVLTEHWRQHYNQVRPHSSLGYRPPVPETILVDQTAQELVKLT
ncbi:MAG: integrase core domain-containing protein [Chloroflexi bacterium]|nr:integrase core domain-containing protein [Chloroflexota bacterium]